VVVNYSERLRQATPHTAIRRGARNVFIGSARPENLQNDHRKEFLLSELFRMNFFLCAPRSGPGPLSTNQTEDELYLDSAVNSKRCISLILVITFFVSVLSGTRQRMRHLSLPSVAKSDPTYDVPSGNKCCRNSSGIMLGDIRADRYSSEAPDIKSKIVLPRLPDCMSSIRIMILEM